MSEQQRISVENKQLEITSYGLFWKADVEKPIANVVIMTGMEEALYRYDDFAKFLNKEGFNVYGVDAFGQGENVLPDGSNRGIWPASGFRKQVQMVDTLVKKIRVTSLPCYIFSHSMGSFMCQDFIQRFTQDVDKVVICGSNNNNIPAKLGYALSKLVVHKKNREKKAGFLNKLMFGNFNKGIKNPRTPYDWLSYNEENVDKYIADPNCGFGPNNGFCLEFMKGMKRLWKKKFLNKIRKDMSIFLISGAEDPVSSFGKGVSVLEKQYKKLKIQNVSSKIYPNMRHEILNELDHQIVYDDIVKFYKGE